MIEVNSRGVCCSQQCEVHGQRHVGPGRVPKHVGVDVRAVRRDRVRGGQHGPDAVRCGQGRVANDAVASGRCRPAARADSVRGQQSGVGGRVQSVHGGRRAAVARTHWTGPAVAVGLHRRGPWSPGKRRTARGHGMADGTVESRSITRRLAFFSLFEPKIRFLSRLLHKDWNRPPKKRNDII